MNCGLFPEPEVYSLPVTVLLFPLQDQAQGFKELKYLEYWKSLEAA